MTGQERLGLTGCLGDTMCSANGPSTPGLLMPLAGDATSDIAFQHLNTLGRVREIRNFGAQYHSRAGSQPVHSSSLPFCVRFNVVVTKHAATLDTGLVANDYPGGIPTRLSSNHFQFALRLGVELRRLVADWITPMRMHRLFVLTGHILMAAKDAWQLGEARMRKTGERRSGRL